jgi:hypothetical protein
MNILAHLEKYASETYLVDGGSLKWWSSFGIGYLDTPALVPYDKEYWDKYLSYRGNGIGEALTAGRVGLTRKVLEVFAYAAADVIDIGIGSGEFVEAMKCWGSDINEHALAWLSEKGRDRDPLKEPLPVLTFWDVLEHIPDPVPLLETASIVLTSLPIYADVYECLLSKHLRPGEHVWHFTDAGIKKFMELAGFCDIYTDDFETRAGREGIVSYVFAKVNTILETPH